MKELDAAVEVLRAGGVVLLPTDTVYGIAALPGHEDRLAALKGRPADMPIAVLVADVEQAAAIGRLDDRARRLATAFWPGPLTIVVPAAGDDGATVGVRCPDHELVRALAARVGPVPTTSANRHGEPTLTTAAAAAAALVEPADLVVDGGELAGTASTVVDLTGPEVAVLREGALPSSAILDVLG